MGHYCDGRVSAVLGTHSHVPTADAWVLPGGTAYQTDVGMCGDYDSVIGMKKEVAVQRFIKKMPGERLAPAEGEGTLCAAVVETDDKTGLATVGPADPAGRPASAGRLNCSILYPRGPCTAIRGAQRRSIDGLGKKRHPFDVKRFFAASARLSSG